MKKVLFGVVGLLVISVPAFASVSSSVQELDQVMRQGTGNSRNKTVHTSSSNVRQMLSDYNAKAHPKSGKLNKIELDVSKPDTGHVLGTVSDTQALLNEINGQGTFDMTKASALLKDLESEGATIGFDGAAYDNCGNPQLDILVLDTKGKTVYAIEGAPCEL